MNFLEKLDWKKPEEDFEVKPGMIVKTYSDEGTYKIVGHCIIEELLKDNLIARSDKGKKRKK